MDWQVGITIFSLTFSVSVASGLLGIGGGIILTPLLLYLPPTIGVGTLGMRQVAGLTMVQGAFAAASGVVRHKKYGFVDTTLVVYMGCPIALSSLLGAVFSLYVGPRTMEAIFAGLAVFAGLLMLIPRSEVEEKGRGNFNRLLAVAVASTVGLVGGIVGQGGAFILIPLMLYVLRLPTRIVLGSSLGIVLFSALAGFIGKVGTGQINFFLAGFLIAGAIPGAQFGGYLSKKVSVVHLRQLLAVLILLAAGKMCWDLLV